ncbi:carbohydrate-binding module family 1 protein [Aaosphaeria arxii CBS 175.79]|uniref:Glucanase n=1 Tax=Aaosphaeria arxii CBS 175.79 TaxID=1450172 RepID=A0A6A5XK18_9PLEO|nr:carbohydrate-binding module family 1 protein [Aaosphaeria arxii CBS 175.79]KAF2013628.1 carbohydrate-binding module family 1 protein [Aaosphaeria arxii CBS 175.79]
MFAKAALFSSLLAIGASAQKVATLTTETHPSLPIQECTSAGSCKSLSTTVTLDANWRWLHTTTGYDNCYTGNSWNTTLCPDGKTCANNCALDGADYSGTYGVTASGGALTLKFVTQGSFSKNIGSRLYLMASDTKYQMFKLLNKEFTFDVDVSKLPCGLNGALYLVEMDEDGGLGRFSTNKAGAKYGTGYCDTQCPHDIKFINGEANVEGWNPSPNDANAGSGKYGSCCHEMDIWEANSISTAYTPHVCSVNGQVRCSGTDCGDGDQRYSGICDKDGCDFNSYRMGDKSFYGPGAKVDTKKPFTVVTQFITSDGTDTGKLSEIRRLYVQNGVVVKNSVSAVSGVTASSSITDNFCKEQKTAFGDNNAFAKLGGLSAMGGAIGRGMVLALSVWDDHAVNMLWLDSTFPTDKDPAAPGVARGTCPTDSGKPEVVEVENADSSVIYSNIKFGAIDSTYKAGGGTTPPPENPGTPGTGGTANKYEQCGGMNWTGPTACKDSTCKKVNDWYSQCL